MTRKEAKTSMRLRKNGVSRTRPPSGAPRPWATASAPRRRGWIDKADIIEGQIVVVSAAGGATCRKDLELDFEIVAELATDSRVFDGAGRDTRRQAARQGLLARRGLGLGQVPRADLRPLATYWRRARPSSSRRM